MSLIAVAPLGLEVCGYMIPGAASPTGIPPPGYDPSPRWGYLFCTMHTIFCVLTGPKGRQIIARGFIPWSGIHHSIKPQRGDRFFCLSKVSDQSDAPAKSHDHSFEVLQKSKIGNFSVVTLQAATLKIPDLVFFAIHPKFLIGTFGSLVQS